MLLSLWISVSVELNRKIILGLNDFLIIFNQWLTHCEVHIISYEYCLLINVLCGWIFFYYFDE